MRMIMFVTFPTERFNEELKQGNVARKIKAILDDTRPEAVYFGEQQGGERGAVVIVDIPSADKLSNVTEPWYLAFGARVEARVAMTAEDVGKPDFEALVKKYG